MNRFGVKSTNPKVLFGKLKHDKNNKTYKFLIIGETDECKLYLLTQIAGNNNLWKVSIVIN